MAAKSDGIGRRGNDVHHHQDAEDGELAFPTADLGQGLTSQRDTGAGLSQNRSSAERSGVSVVPQRAPTRRVPGGAPNRGHLSILLVVIVAKEAVCGIFRSAQLLACGDPVRAKIGGGERIE